MKNMKKGQAIAWLIAFVLLTAILIYEASLILSSTGKGADQNIKLGLDLAGGVSITYEVEGDTPTEEQMNDTIYKLQQRIENDLGSSQTTEAIPLEKRIILMTLLQAVISLTGIWHRYRQMALL